VTCLQLQRPLHIKTIHTFVQSLKQQELPRREAIEQWLLAALLLDSFVPIQECSCEEFAHCQELLDHSISFWERERSSIFDGAMCSVRSAAVAGKAQRDTRQEGSTSAAEILCCNGEATTGILYKPFSVASAKTGEAPGSNTCNRTRQNSHPHEPESCSRDWHAADALARSVHLMNGLVRHLMHILCRACVAFVDLFRRCNRTDYVLKMRWRDAAAIHMLLIVSENVFGAPSCQKLLFSVLNCQKMYWLCFALLCFAVLCKTMQNNAKQCKAKQSNAKQNDVKQSKAKQSNANQCKAKHKQCKAMQSKAKRCKAMQSNAK